jgi:endo-1,4-beta-xylanase
MFILQQNKNSILVVYLTALSISIATGQESLKQYAAKYNLAIGTCTAWGAVNSNEASYMNILKKDFNTVVCENEMKFSYTEPSRGNFSFGSADKIVSVAQQNNMKVRGHCLVWHGQNPGWITSGTWNRQTLLAAMKEHITGVVTHYKGKVYEWDVVNEAFSDGSAGTMRNSIWKNNIGEDFMDSAFVYAHAADPNALLVYNDYSTSTINVKSTAVYNKIKKMLENKIPINGVGFQSHQQISDYSDTFYNDLKANFERFAALGLNISITELDVRIPTPTDQTKLQTQADIYKAYIQATLATPACKTFMVWGFTDKYSWIPGTFPGTNDGLLYTSSYQPKPAYTSMLDILKNYQVNVVYPDIRQTQATMEMSKNQAFFNLLGEKVGSYTLQGNSLRTINSQKPAHQIYIGKNANKSAIKMIPGK